MLVENISEWFSVFFLAYRCVLGSLAVCDFAASFHEIHVFSICFYFICVPDSMKAEIESTRGKCFDDFLLARLAELKLSS